MPFASKSIADRTWRLQATASIGGSIWRMNGVWFMPSASCQARPGTTPEVLRSLLT